MLSFLLFVTAFSVVRCRKCKGSEFSVIKDCRQTGYVKDTGHQSCLPVLGQTYGEAAQVIVVLVIVGVNFFLMAKIRRSLLVAKIRKPDAL